MDVYMYEVNDLRQAKADATWNPMTGKWKIYTCEPGNHVGAIFLLEGGTTVVCTAQTDENNGYSWLDVEVRKNVGAELW